MFKKLLIFTFALTAISAMAQKNIVDEVVWVVGDEPILLSDVEDSRIAAELQGESSENAYCTIPEEIAIQKLYIHQADLDSIDVDETQAIKYADFYISRAQSYYGSKENMEIVSGKTTQQLREMYKELSRTQQQVQGVQANLTRNIKVTPAEVREYYKTLDPDSIPTIPTTVEVEIITSTPKVSREEVLRVENQLREFARRINEGEKTFASLALAYSQDKVSARNGGDLGQYMGRADFVPEFSAVAFTLNDPKKVSKIVKTEYGYHIIQLIDKKGDKARFRHILLKPEIETSEYLRCMGRLDSIATDIREGKFTFEDAARELSDDKDTRLNHGLLSYKDPETGTVASSHFEMKQLPQEIALTIDTMQVGEISRAFTMTTERGQEITAIVKLKSRTEAHKATPTEDFQILHDKLYAKRSEEKIEKWIQEKINKTYVRISPDYRECNFKYSGWIK